jgi:two-component system cell cycle sensor histidine kinase/response regulator CckA
MESESDKGGTSADNSQLELNDLTDPHETLGRLRRSEMRYRRLFETAQDGILILEAKGGHIIDANPFLLEFLGYENAEMFGKQLWQIGLFEDIEANREAFRVLIEKSFIRYDDLPLKTKDGKAKAVEFVSNVYTVGEERVIQCNIRDITDRKAAEVNLRQTEEKLRQSKKLEAMGRLSGGIAHDFNNMLTAINGYTGLALNLVEPETVLHGYLTQVLLAGERSSALTRQLLAFSRQQILAPQVLRLNSVVVEMQPMLERLIGEAVSLGRSLEPELGCIRADPVQMQQILMNLVINASDSMPQGGDITISTRNARLDGAYARLHPDAALRDFVLLTVSDSGTGMTPEVLVQAFDPFFTTKEFGKGTGMGLATVQGIVEQSGGHIVVESALGKGTVFRIYLPITHDMEDCPAEPSPSHGSEERGGETILIAEDEPMVRAFVLHTLGNYGYRVLEAENGVAAQELMRKTECRIDMLLTDLMMPGMNGRELARRYSDTHPDGVVLFMSGHTDDLIFQQNLVEDGVDFIQKPFTPAKLIDAVRGMLVRGVSKPG